MLGLFPLEMARFGANSVVYFDRNVRLFTARTTRVTVYCLRLTGSSYWEGSGDGAVTSPQKILRLSVEIAPFSANAVVYFNRNVSLFTGPRQLL